jgi:hypothetical protein
MAYVVRTVDLEGRERVKVWRALPDARDAFALADGYVPSERVAAYLYEVPGEDDARAAVQAVKDGKAVILDRSLTFDEILKSSGL